MTYQNIYIPYDWADSQEKHKEKTEVQACVFWMVEKEDNINTQKLEDESSYDAFDTKSELENYNQEAFFQRWTGQGALKNVVSCACVRKSGRKVTKEVVKSALDTGTLTFPSCLKQSGPLDLPIQCVVTQDKRIQHITIILAYLHVTITEKGKFLLAARRYGQGAHTKYIISLNADEISQGSNTYVGKIKVTNVRSHIIGTNFRIYDSQPSSDRRRVNSLQLQHPALSFPRRMRCMVKGLDQNTTKKRDGSYDTVGE
ncbi:tubby-like F-box protein 8 [Impatiens glandulifera]|uniref:tubby-like F-box protein 8 n=1 Tax=Impatiens glandulifera TaxID=253017 RepID=UPI001FB0EB77|nr:tubby-like F-box protein 8 [Impatiens glandulifera]